MVAIDWLFMFILYEMEHIQQSKERLGYDSFFDETTKWLLNYSTGQKYYFQQSQGNIKTSPVQMLLENELNITSKFSLSSWAALSFFSIAKGMRKQNHCNNIDFEII